MLETRLDKKVTIKSSQNESEAPEEMDELYDVRNLVGKFLEHNKEEIALHKIKYFKKQFNVRIIERQTFKSDKVIDYISLRETGPDAAGLDEIEDKNWFDEDSLLAKSGGFSDFAPDFSNSPKDPEVRMNHKRLTFNETRIIERATSFTQGSVSRESEIFNYENKERMKTNRGSMTCLMTAVMFISIIILLIVKAATHNQMYNRYFDWTTYLHNIHGIEIYLNEIVTSAMKIENKASGFMYNDFRASNYESYQQNLNSSTKEFYSRVVAIRFFSTNSDKTKYLPLVETFYKDFNGIITKEQESLPFALKHIFSSSMLLVAH